MVVQIGPRSAPAEVHPRRDARVSTRAGDGKQKTSDPGTSDPSELTPAIFFHAFSVKGRTV